MLKFIRGSRSTHLNSERQRLHKELIGYSKTVHHGFPNKPTAIAWDPKLRIIGLGTLSGEVRVYGKPGVEFYGRTNSEQAITKLLFIPNEGRLISLCDNSCINLWEIHDNCIKETNSLLMEGKLKNVSCLCLATSKKILYLGTEGGNIYKLNIDNFKIDEDGIYQDVIIQNLPEGHKNAPGAVEIITEQPDHPDNILIGYARGSMIIWNTKSKSAIQVYSNSQQLESLCWNSKGSKFVTGHNDGSYAYWSSDIGGEPIEEPSTIYGPFPCKAIQKIIWKRSLMGTNDDLLIFSGGMPRASYSDRFTVTVQKGTQKHVAFDFTSKVLDFVSISSTSATDICEILLILLEEELIAIDLTCPNDNWRQMPLPYLNALHASVVTSTLYVSDIDPVIWTDLLKAGSKNQTTSGSSSGYSNKEWLVDGGVLKNSDDKPGQDLLITGHEDGTVRFWNAGTIAMSLIYVLKTGAIFSDDDFIVENEPEPDDEEEWPPFKRIGNFDPCCDDPRLSIKRIFMCPYSGILTIGGAAGQILVYKLNSVEASGAVKLKVSVINNVHDKENFIWKGSKRLNVRGHESLDEIESCSISLTFPAPGYQPCSILQLHPPVIVTALTADTKWNLLACGSSYGLAIYDYQRNATVLVKCTLDFSDISTINEPPISRTKSFKKSLRESFRRIRKGRSMRQPDKRSGSKLSNSPVSTPAGANKSAVVNENSTSTDSSFRNVGSKSPADIMKPVERAIEARSADDTVGSMVRCLCFGQTFLSNTHHTTPTLWAGTNNGTVYIFMLQFPSDDNSSEKRGGKGHQKVTAVLGKEIQLKHKAPVVSIVILDGVGRPFPESSLEIEKTRTSLPPDNSSPHHVIIISEEQFKLFSLPNLKPICKLKLTAIEGARVRRVCVTKLISAAEQYCEYFLNTLTNLGECIVLSIPELKRVFRAAPIRKEDINGISTLAFTKYGEAMFFISSSEVQRFTLSTTHKLIPKCTLNLPLEVRKKLRKSEENEEEDESEGDVVKSDFKPPIITNTIPEEDEEDSESSLIKQKQENKVTSTTDEVSETTFDDSAITVDSVRCHLANLSTSRVEEVSSTTTVVKEDPKDDTSPNKASAI